MNHERKKMNSKILDELIKEKEIKLSEKIDEVTKLEGIILVKKDQLSSLKKEIKEDEKQLSNFKSSYNYIKKI